MKDAFYFGHDSNARHDPKLIAFIEEYGIAGHAYFFILIEILREQKNYTFPKYLISALAKEWQTHGSAMAPQNILDSMVKLQLIAVNEEGYYSPSLCQRMEYFEDIKKKRSDAGKAGAKALWQTHGKRMAKDSKERKEKKEKKEKNNTPPGCVFDFNSLWVKYPSKEGKRDAERHFHAQVKTEQDWRDINTALDNYVQSDRVKRNFIKNGSTWFNNWRDWIVPPMAPRTRMVGCTPEEYKAIEKAKEEKYMAEQTKTAKV